MTDFVTFSSLTTEPYERGVELGTALAGPVAATVASYRRLWEWLDPDFDLTYWGGRALESITTQAARAAEEIAGIAAGSGRRVEEIAALNARTEVLGAIALVVSEADRAFPTRLAAEAT